MQNLFNPGTAVLNYGATKKYGTLCYDTNEDNWLSVLTGRSGFGWGNVANSWSIEQRYKNLKREHPLWSDDYCRETAKKEHQKVYLHESIHVGQQRFFGPVATIDLALEQLIPSFFSLFYGRSALNYPYIHSFLLGFEHDAFLHENDERVGGSSDNLYSQFNRWRWW
jgi:hypothetical protein